jgi:hypothetical protein
MRISAWRYRLFGFFFRKIPFEAAPSPVINGSGSYLLSKIDRLTCWHLFLLLSDPLPVPASCVDTISGMGASFVDHSENVPTDSNLSFSRSGAPSRCKPEDRQSSNQEIIAKNHGKFKYVHGVMDTDALLPTAISLPLAPPGTRVLVHETPPVRQTWSPHGVEG